MDNLYIPTEQERKAMLERTQQELQHAMLEEQLEANEPKSSNTITVVVRQTVRSNELRALDNNLPYELLRGKLGRSWPRPWLNKQQ